MTGGVGQRLSDLNFVEKSFSNLKLRQTSDLCRFCISGGNSAVLETDIAKVFRFEKSNSIVLVRYSKISRLSNGA